MKLYQMLIQPFRVWKFRGDACFDFFVRDDPTFLRVNEQHPAGTQAVLVQHVFRRNIQNARFGGQNDQIILCYIITDGRSPFRSRVAPI